MILNSALPKYTIKHDTGWQTLIMDENVTAYSIPALSGDLSNALTIDISLLGFKPRQVLLRPVDYSASNTNTLAQTSNYAVSSVVTFLNPETGLRASSGVGWCDLIRPTNVANGGCISLGNIGFYVTTINNLKVLVLSARASNGVSNAARLYQGNWSYRIIG